MCRVVRIKQQYHRELTFGGSLDQVHVQCNQAREQNFFISEFEPILAHKIRSIIDKSLNFGTNLLQHKLYIKFKLWDVTVITSIFMAS